MDLATVRGFTSKLLRGEFPRLRSRLPPLWSRSYFVSSVSNVSAATIQKVHRNAVGAPSAEGCEAVKVNRGCVRRLVLAPAQTATMDEQGHAARAMWNLPHAWRAWGGRPRSPNLEQADEAIRRTRKDIPWLADPPAQAAQQVLKTYVRAWKNCWEGRAQVTGLKGRMRSRMAVDAPQGRDLAMTRLSRHVGQARIPKVGVVRFRWSGPIPGVGRETGRITGARLVEDAPAQHPGSDVGVDRGVTVALVLSGGNDHTHGAWIRAKEAERLLPLERKAARQERARRPFEKTSNRLHRTYDQIATMRARIKRRRDGWQHNTTTALAERYGIVVVEDLRVGN